MKKVEIKKTVAEILTEEETEKELFEVIDRRLNKDE